MQSIVTVWLPLASGVFCDLPLGNKLGSQVSREKHQRTDHSISITVIDTCFSLIKPLDSPKIEMWFYHHKIIHFMYHFKLKYGFVMK